MSEDEYVETLKCPYCGNEHDAKCFLIKAIEYFPDGEVRRVEFMTPRDLNAGQPSVSVPSNWYPFQPATIWQSPISSGWSYSNG